MRHASNSDEDSPRVLNPLVAVVADEDSSEEDETLNLDKVRFEVVSDMQSILRLSATRVNGVIHRCQPPQVAVRKVQRKLRKSTKRR